MPVPHQHSHRHAFHTTHLNNIAGILKQGFLSVNEQKQRGLEHHSIAATSIQERRSRMEVPCGPRGTVHDYVPLYFTKRSPMLLAQVQAKNVDQILLYHFAFPIDIVEREHVIFTDSAANRDVPPNWYSDPADLDQLNWDAIDTKKWGSDSDIRKRERMAEILVHTYLDPKDAKYIVAWSSWAEKQLKKVYEELELEPPPIYHVGQDHPHEFVHFRRELPDDMRQKSIAAGPYWTQHCFDTTIKSIVGTRQNDTETRFSSLEELLIALRVSLDALPETRELVGLESHNEVHDHDVGTHTLQVVEKLRTSQDYSSLQVEERELVELAAYLHDIGKGPKSRWVNCGNKQQVDADHPIKSMQMLVRIMTEEIPAPDEEAIRTLCKLVCYHDLVGDIIGKGRERSQLVSVAENETDLNLLIAIGKADMAAVNSSWMNAAHASSIRELHKWARAQLKERDDQ